MSEWRPIETAPINERIQVRCNGDRIGVAEFSSKRYYLSDRWIMVIDEWLDDEGEEIVTPTHWMPLPEPPGEGAHE